MTNAPPDLAAFRTGTVIPLTGLQGDNVGIAPDAAHLSSGGYHVGCADIQSISRWNVDYSTRQSRDRQQPNTNVSSAMDIGDDWPHGGRAAWLRFNNLLVAQLRGRDPELAALRAVNFSPDGTARKRYDSLNPGDGVINSTDSVYMHTHLEWWRDTVGTTSRARSLARIGQIIDAAIRNIPLEDDMGAKQDAEVSNANRYGWALVAGLPKVDGIYNPDVLAAGTTTVTNWTVATLQQLAAAAAENKVRDTALAAAVQALAVGSGIDVDGLMAHVEAAVQAAVQPLQAQLAAADARAEKLAAALAAAGGALEAADN
jgi:uncharacterized protein